MRIVWFVLLFAAAASASAASSEHVMVLASPGVYILSPDGKTLIAQSELKLRSPNAGTVDEETGRLLIAGGATEKHITAIEADGTMTPLFNVPSFRGGVGIGYDEKRRVVWVPDQGRDWMVRAALRDDGPPDIEVIKGFKNPAAAVCDPEDGSVWIADTGAPHPDNSKWPPSWIVKLDHNGHRTRVNLRGYRMLGTRNRALDLDADFVYVADHGNNRVVVLQKDGTLRRELPLPRPVQLSADGQGNVWVSASSHTDRQHPKQLVKISAEGEILVRRENMNAYGMAATTGGCWIACSQLSFVDNNGASTVLGRPEYGPSNWEFKDNHRARKVFYCPR